MRSTDRCDKRNPMPKTLAYSLSIEFHPDEGGYLASFPALPGCHSWGASYEEAVKNAEEALLGYLEALRKNGEAINNHGNRCLPSS